jgi:GNAT superfamily N-acetyltransferase
MYFEYIKEKMGRDVYIYEDKGFATYEIRDKELYVVDAYVKPEYRRQGVIRKMFEHGIQVAKENGCTHITCAVEPHLNNPEQSMTAFLHIGFKIFRSLEGWIILKKDI